ncbi:hypothetical protein [uncultured Methanobrevibacter sp.]|uniref:hypothetical protein n=1 Tax=uncultured Methanobrevibacter sp. TaxID=253161 RepID=UPI0025DA6FB1|nr:hypothetical protein [uncultured Methanobrevibacter sp.]
MYIFAINIYRYDTGAILSVTPNTTYATNNMAEYAIKKYLNKIIHTYQNKAQQELFSYNMYLAAL